MEVIDTKLFEDIGPELLFPIVEWPEWCHRKVESLHLLEGERARRRVSIDCTPVGVACPINNEQILVPLTWIKKGAMRGFDLKDASGAAVPILGRIENESLSLGLVQSMLDASIQIRDDVRNRSLTQVRQQTAVLVPQICHSEPQEARAAVARVLELGDLPALVENLLWAFADSFLLIAVLRRDRGGIRQVLKFSFHWELVQPPASLDGSSWLTRLKASMRRDAVFARAALGHGVVPFGLSVASLDTARSYHLEVPMPPGVLSTRLELPPGIGGQPVDSKVTAVAHAHSSYVDTELPAASSSIARLHLKLSDGGARRTMTVAAVGTATFFALAVSLPGALSTLQGSTGGAASLLLFGPALLIATLARPGENVIVSRVLLPLRVVALLLTGMLLSAGASLVGGLDQPWLEWLWGMQTVTSVTLAIVLVSAYLRRLDQDPTEEGGHA